MTQRFQLYLDLPEAGSGAGRAVLGVGAGVSDGGGLASGGGRRGGARTTGGPGGGGGGRSGAGREWPGLTDLEAVPVAERERLVAAIRARAGVFVAVGIASVTEIDTLNILRATHLAMARALAPIDGVVALALGGRAAGPGPALSASGDRARRPALPLDRRRLGGRQGAAGRAPQRARRRAPRRRLRPSQGRRHPRAPRRPRPAGSLSRAPPQFRPVVEAARAAAERDYQTEGWPDHQSQASRPTP